MQLCVIICDEYQNNLFLYLYLYTLMKIIEKDENVLFFNKVSCKLMYQDDGVHILMNGLDYRYFDENEPELIQENNDIYIIINGEKHIINDIHDIKNKYNLRIGRMTVDDNFVDIDSHSESEMQLVLDNINDIIQDPYSGDICDALVLGNLVQKMIDELVETNQIVKIKIIFENILCNFYIKTLIKWLKCIVNCKCKSIFKNILQEIYNEYDFTSAPNKLALLQDLENYL